MNTRVWLNSQEITTALIGDDWPDYLETSVKGTGFTEWEVRPFRFRAIVDAPEVGTLVRVAVDGVTRLYGSVSSVEDAMSDTPLIEALPFGGTLKDVRAGVEEADDAGRLRWAFRLSADTPIQAALETLLDRYTLNKPVHLAGTSWAVDVPGSTADILGVFAPYGLTAINGAQGAASSSPAQYQAAGLPTPSTYELVQVRDGGDVVKLGVRVVGEELDGSPVSQVRTFDLPVTGPPDGNSISSQTYIGVGAWAAFPLLNGTTSTDVDSGRALAYASRVTGASDLEFVAAVQQTAGVWTVVKRRDQELRTWAYVVWWGDPRQQTVRGVWFNKSMADMVKLFALVSGRWLRFDGSSVSLPLRSSDLGGVSLPDSSLTLEYDEQRQQQTPPPATIQVQAETTSSNPDPEGLAGWTESKTVALNWYYNDRFSGVLRTTEAEYIAGELPSGLELLSLADGIGHVVGLDYSTDGHTVRVRAIEEAAG